MDRMTWTCAEHTAARNKVDNNIPVLAIPDEVLSRAETGGGQTTSPLTQEEKLSPDHFNFKPGVFVAH